MDRTRHPTTALTPRQREVWRLVAKGHTNGEIADQLGISLDGAKWHVSELLDRLDVANRDQLAELWADEHTTARRAGRWLAGLVALPSLKAAAGAAGVLTLAAGTVIVALALHGAGSGGGAANADVAAAATLPPQPTGALWTPAQALAQAQSELGRILAEPDFANRVQGKLRAGDLQLASAAYVAGITELDFGAGASSPPSTGATDNNYWTYKDGITRDTWDFQWQLANVPLRDGRAPTGDLHIEILIEDGKRADALAAQVLVVSGAGTEVFSGFGIRSRHIERMDAFTTTAQRFAWLDNVAGGPWLGVFVTAEGMVCESLFSAAGVPGMRFCIGYGGTFPVRSGISASTAGWTLTDPAARLLVHTEPGITRLEITSAGDTRSFDTNPAPATWPIAERFAYITLPAWGLTYALVGFDSDGHEVSRSDGSAPPAPGS